MGQCQQCCANIDVDKQEHIDGQNEKEKFLTLKDAQSLTYHQARQSSFIQSAYPQLSANPILQFQGHHTNEEIEPKTCEIKSTVYMENLYPDLKYEDPNTKFEDIKQTLMQLPKLPSILQSKYKFESISKIGKTINQPIGINEL